MRLAGGILGLGLGVLGIRGMLSINTAGIPRVGENGMMVQLDWRVVAFTLGVAVATGILFGLIPALQGSRADLGSSLKESGGRNGDRPSTEQTSLGARGYEVTLALILLVGSALLIRTGRDDIGQPRL
jgi:putative ABC transport system permease protein